MAEFTVDNEILHEFVGNDKGERLRAFNSLGGSPHSLARHLKSDLENGPCDDAATSAARIKYFGKNELPPPEEVTFFGLLLGALSDPMMILLSVSALISLVLGLTVADPHTGLVDWAHGWIEGTAILISVCLVTMVSSVNDYQKEQKFKELSAAAEPSKYYVIRNKNKREELEKDLLVGDILHLTSGQIVPADGVFVRGQGFRLDESAITGENDEIEKGDSEIDPFFRSGTYVLEGEGDILITAVGELALAGRIAMELRKEKKNTPLQDQLGELADLIGYLGMGAAGLMFVVLSIKELLKVYYWHTAEHLVLKKFLDMITTSVTIVVVAVPEGLPLSVTIALAYSMKQMMKENNLVRHLAACETMGGATSICTDKTGTLTQNEMTVMRGYVGGRKFEFTSEKAHDAEEVKNINGCGKQLAELLNESISVNSTTQKKTVQVGNQHVSRYVGNKTEQAMLYFVEKLGGSPARYRGQIEPENQRLFPFTSKKKSMTTCVRVSTGRGVVMRYFVKGASEIVLEKCSTYHSGVAVERMSEARREDISQSIGEFARNRLRTLCIAYADVEGKSSFDDKEAEWPSHLTFLGIIGIEDPIRPEVEDAVRRCKNAGVAVRMVTGDNKATAISIAKKAGIYGDVYWGKAKGEAGLALEGKVFREMAKSASTLNKILPRLQVLARASPLDKQILVGALMDRGEVVAVTGDGTNDAPALKNANVGFAMNTGTDVAKKASDVVILDDNFRSIVTAMKWGRNVNDNICKFIQFQTTVNVAAVFIAFVGAILSGSGESPLKPVQLLWLNLIMDTMAALALATELPTEQLLDRPPRSRDTPLISRRMWLNILGQATYQIAVQLWLLNGGHKHFGVTKDSALHLTIIFNIFVLMQVANEFNARMLHGGVNFLSGITRAPLFIMIIFITLIVQVVGVTYFGPFMKTVPLSPRLWRLCLKFSVMPIPIGILLRLIPVTEVETEIGHDVNDDNDPALTSQRTRKLTFQEAATAVIAQLKVAGALSANAYAKKAKTE